MGFSKNVILKLKFREGYFKNEGRAHKIKITVRHYMAVCKF